MLGNYCEPLALLSAGRAPSACRHARHNSARRASAQLASVARRARRELRALDRAGRARCTPRRNRHVGDSRPLASLRRCTSRAARHVSARRSSLATVASKASDAPALVRRAAATASCPVPIRTPTGSPEPGGSWPPSPPRSPPPTERPRRGPRERSCVSRHRLERIRAASWASPSVPSRQRLRALRGSAGFEAARSVGRHRCR